jgi:BirA family transcriptional regulator, biotin operon repressor / biotin---[acetyl-CoA-carboxylase] ligase
MKALIIGKDIEVVESVDSTNEYAKQTLRPLLEGHGYWVFTEQQKKGRGQSGNIWISDSAGSFTGSFVVQPQAWPGKEQAWAVRAQRLFALCVQHSLQEYLKINNQIKWPNDIYVDGKKAGGMLIEVGWQHGKPAWTVAGLGLNLSEYPTLPSFAGHLNTPLPPITFLMEWGAVFKKYWEEYRFWDDERLLGEYERGLWGFKELRWFEESFTGHKFEGKAVGVDEQNRLLLQRSSESEPVCYDIKAIKWL